MTIATRPSRAYRGADAALVLGAGLATAVVVVSLVSIVWTPYPLASADPGAALQGPSGEHWLGVDPIGRDLLSLTMKGLVASIGIPLAALIVAALLGLPIGFLAALSARGSRRTGIAEYLVLLPALFVALVLAAILGPSALVPSAAIAIASVLPLAGAVRDALRSVQDRPYLDAARLAGLSRWEALRAHVLREIVADVAIAGCKLTAAGIAAEATISFVGIGMQAPGVSLGLLLHDAQGYASSTPLPTIAIGLVLVAAIGGFRLLARGIARSEKARDAAA